MAELRVVGTSGMKPHLMGDSDNVLTISVEERANRQGKEGHEGLQREEEQEAGRRRYEEEDEEVSTSRIERAPNQQPVGFESEITAKLVERQKKRKENGSHEKSG